ncbi:MAG: DNA repair protein RadC [Bacteroidales bacterium]|nr:DNA repair protein RadC [Bacteroidales bacterium]
MKNDTQETRTSKTKEPQRFSIKEWAVEDRPREKLLNQGAGNLSNAELIAILLGSGSRTESALDLAKRILNAANNNLIELGKLNLKTLCREFKGVGPVKAVVLSAALELGRRRRSSDVLSKHQIHNSRDIYNLFHPKLADLPHEECWLLLMNNQHRIIESLRISHGGVSETTVDPKIVLKHALDKLASSIVLCHNHPSGNPKPSTADDKITHKLKMACVNLDIQLTDHIIVSEGIYFSYADEGKL